MKQYYCIRLTIADEISDSYYYEIYGDCIYDSFDKAMEYKLMIEELIEYSHEYLIENEIRYESIPFDFTSEHSDFISEWSIFYYYSKIFHVEIITLLNVEIDETLVDLHTKYIKNAN